MDTPPLPTDSTPESAVLHRSLHRAPLKVLSASGHHLHLSNGQRILDATGGAAVACLGHANPRIAAAVASQMSRVSYCHSLTFATDAAEQLATYLCRTTDGAMTRAFFVSSGSEAMEAALKMAHQYHLEKPQPEPQRTHFIARHESYHGTTLGALAVGGHKSRRALFEPILSVNTSHVSACHPYRNRQPGESDEAYVARLADELDAEFRRLGPDTVAAFVAEPVVGAALGCVPSVPGYFKAMKAVCERNGALLILDEVMSGCGRTGTLHAWQAPGVGVAPDIQTLGKGLGGGAVPVAAMLVGKRVVDVLSRGTGAFSHGQTYQGHPVACAAALETLKTVQEDGLVENVARMGDMLGRLLMEKVGRHKYVGNVRGRGLFWGIEFVKDKETKEPFPLQDGVAMGVHELGLQEPYNISIYPGTGTVDGKVGDHVLLAPAYNVTQPDIEEIVDLTAAVIEAYFRIKDER
ncbi:PLP-dependent transferase [Myriangium duriaei CBS 260.36]|uniref:PLP-dependent transferase n=1 Tax=Myriangium duriaei CBS 260.36 TaxID=1168546 RepID=A0A9P4JCN5_9PEZI|nr:PLP-dependent transferase [Myriangium duriaei CBS 260.36]